MLGTHTITPRNTPIKPQTIIELSNTNGDPEYYQYTGHMHGLLARFYGVSDNADTIKQLSEAKLSRYLKLGHARNLGVHAPTLDGCTSDTRLPRRSRWGVDELADTFPRTLEDAREHEGYYTRLRDTNASDLFTESDFADPAPDTESVTHDGVGATTDDSDALRDKPTPTVN